MTIAARFSGTCPECGERWQPGDLIRAVDDWDGSPTWTHAVCPDAPDPLGIRPGERVCLTCWLVHPEGECDR